VLFTQDKHGYYHASVNTNLIQNGSVIAFTTVNAPTSSTYDIPLLLDPEQKQTVYENCDWNLGYVDNLPSSIYFHITFFNCMQRTRFDRAFFNTNNYGFQNLFNNVAQGTVETVKVNDYNGAVFHSFHEANASGIIGIKFQTKVPLAIGHSVVFSRSWCNEIKNNVPYYVIQIPDPLEQTPEDRPSFMSANSDDVDYEDLVTDPLWYCSIKVSATSGGTAINFSGVEDNLFASDEGVPAHFSYTLPATITQADINKKFEKTPLYPYLPGSDYVLGYKYDTQGKVIEGTGQISNTNYYPSAAKYVNTGVHIHPNELMDALYDDTCITAEEVVQQLNSQGVIKGSGINRNAVIFPYTVDLLFEYY
jgi:hypothetical protein